VVGDNAIVRVVRAEMWRSEFVHQVKLFVGLESSVAELEEIINAWLKESGVRVVNLIGNIAPQTVTRESKGSALAERKFSSSDLFLAVVYEVN